MTQSIRATPVQSPDGWVIAGRTVHVSNLGKTLWPADGLTKSDLLRYYLDLAATVLPYVRGRPLVMKSYPNGIEGPYYFRQDLSRGAPAWMSRYATEPATKRRLKQMPLVNDASSLIWLANQGAIELHPWLSRIDLPDRPDLVALDLDVVSPQNFTLTLEAALLLRSDLEAFGLRAFPKTSGGDGLHLYIPVQRRYTFEETRSWVRSLAERLESEHPALVTTQAARAGRTARVLIDYAQNSLGKTTVAPYSVRPRPMATVSAPLSWAEIEAGTARPADFRLETMRRRLEEVGDLFRPVLSTRQRLPRLRVR